MPRIEMKDLFGLVVTQGIPATSDVNDKIISDVIAAGPITKQPRTDAFRIVLRATERGEFVVHQQSFPNFVVGVNLEEFAGCEFAHGDYFPASDLVAATQRFAERLTKTVSSIGSVYRDLSEAA